MTILDYLSTLYSAQTVDTYFRHIKRFKLARRNHKSATYSQIVKYLNSLKKGKQVALAAIKKYYDFLEDTGQREDHPCRRLTIKRPKRMVQFQRLFTSEELDLLLNRENRYQALFYRNKSILSLLIYQGLTSENIANLRLDDLNLDEGIIYIKATSKLHRRTLELKAKQTHWLLNYMLRNRGESECKTLFLTKRGQPVGVQTIERMLRPLKHLFPNKTLNTITIRKSVIANWLNNDHKSIENAQALAGHKWISTTEKYKRSDIEKKKKMVERFHPF